MKTIAISQSNYIPWKGYFDLIAYVDEFVLYDDMQYTRRDWRNRNKIKTPNGLQWLSVPVKVKGKYQQTIRETMVDGDVWKSAHWKSLRQNYARAACFEEISEWLEPLYTTECFDSLSALNRRLIEAICSYLGIDTVITNSWDYALDDGKNERLASISKQAGANRYISGPAAKKYLDEAVFAQHSIEVNWYNYQGYAEYRQLWGEFEHGVTVLDLLFNCGAESKNFLRHLA